jgi:hypothetical protein
VAITVEDGKIVVEGGSIGTGEACCCKKCEGPCDEENPCPEGCICCNGVCVEEIPEGECCGPCDEENPCPEGCICCNGVCVEEIPEGECCGPCDENEDCEPGCRCLDGECVEECRCKGCAENLQLSMGGQPDCFDGFYFDFIQCAFAGGISAAMYCQDNKWLVSVVICCSDDVEGGFCIAQYEAELDSENDCLPPAGDVSLVELFKFGPCPELPPVTITK